MWDLKCIASALCFLTSNVLFIVHGVSMMKEHHTSSAEQGSSAASDNHHSFNGQEWKELNPTYIQERWVQREVQRPIMMSAALFGAVAWFWLIVPIVQAAWVLSRGGKRSVGVHMALAALAICGGIIELLARLLTVGMTNASQWLANDFNLGDWYAQNDGTGWRVLEMIHIITMGMLLWIDAFEAMALFGIFVVIFYSVATEPKFRMKRNSSILVESEHDEGDTTGADAASGASASSGVVGNTELSGTVYRSDSPSPPPPSSAFAAVSSKVPVQPTFTKCFAWYGLFVGLLAVLDFVADVLRFVNWRLFGRISMATNALVGCIFLPIWLLCLASQLPAATERFEREAKRDAILLNAVEDEKAALTGKNRSYGSMEIS